MKAIPVAMLKDATRDTLIPLAENGIGFVMLFRDFRDSESAVEANLGVDAIPNPAVKAGGVLDWLLHRTRSGETSLLVFNLPAGMDPRSLIDGQVIDGQVINGLPEEKS